MNPTLNGTIDEIKAKNNAMLSKAPRELVDIARLEGARNTHLMPILHSYAFTFGQHEFFYHLKELALKEELPLDSLRVIAKTLLESEAVRSKGFFEVTEFPTVARKVSSTLDLVSTYAEYVRVIEQFQQYLSLWCYWADIQIPFDKLTDAFERYTRNRSRRRK
jgi:hypothetical protein